ncbi:MAG: hypothetical protein JHC31_04695 [Sulfurihydrogenibium sp.]|jgi:predicted Holliday junction resolvase-like endonuclease|nr:hypothetical protein [Sulfurihydrogenibium sp.]
MEILIVVNIVVILINTGLLLYLFIEVFKLKKTTEIKFKMLEETFEARFLDLSDAVKFLTKLNLKRLKGEEGKTKIVPFKPEDLEKVKEQLNVSH